MVLNASMHRPKKQTLRRFTRYYLLQKIQKVSKKFAKNLACRTPPEIYFQLFPIGILRL